MSLSIEFKRLTIEDMSAFSSFLGKCYGKGFFSRTEESIHRHFKNPAGDSIIYGAWDGDKLVGTNALQKINMFVNGQTVLMAHSFSSATDPDYRRELIRCDGKIETIYTRLNTLCRQQAVQEGCRLTYGFPNDNAIIPTIKFAGYKNTGTLKIYIDVLRFAEILVMKYPYLPLSFCKGLMLIPQMILSARSFFRPKSRGDFQILEADHISKEYDEFAKDASKYYTILQNRDAAFLTWRFLTSPALEYHLIEARKQEKLYGYLIYCLYPYPERDEQRILCGYIVDFFVLPNEEGMSVLYNLLYQVSKIFRKQKAVISTSIHHTPDQFDKIFAKAGYFIPMKKIMPRPIYFLTRSESNDVNDDDFIQTVSDLGSWYLNLADNDII